METVDSKEEGMENLTTIFRVLSSLDAINILLLAGEGINNSTHAIKELDLTQKKYYAKLKSLVESGLVKKINGSYRQTPLGNIIYNRYLLSMERVFDAKDKLGVLEYLEGAQIENGVRALIEEELKIPGFERPSKVKLLGDYEALAIEVIDLYDSAEENVLLASNYFDVRVIEAVLRAVDRGITCRCIAGKKSLSSRVKTLKSMLSLKFTKAIIDFTSSKVELEKFVRFSDLPYTFVVVDGQHNIIEVSTPISEEFILALSIDDEGVAEKLTEFYETLWGTGENKTIFKVLTSIGTKLNGDAPHQDSEL